MSKTFDFSALTTNREHGAGAQLRVILESGRPMLIVILLSVFVILGLLAGLSQRRAKRIQSDPNFAPTDHVEIKRFSARLGRGIMTTETHHDQDPPDFQAGD